MICSTVGLITLTWRRASGFSRLVGIDEAKTRLTKILGVLVNPAGPRAWAKKHHRDAQTLLDYVERRPPLVILAGDVGTGKTELAETVGDACFAAGRHFRDLVSNQPRDAGQRQGWRDDQAAVGRL